ncbi:chitin-binding protein, partial [Streptomyces huasconensis]
MGRLTLGLPAYRSRLRSHGYTDLPASRQINCAKGVVTNCGSIQYEPQ